MRILVVQTSFLGDTVLSTPIIPALKTLYPDSEIWMMTTPAAHELISRDPLLSGTIVYDKRGKDRGLKGFINKAKELRKLQFSRVYSLHRSYRTSMLLALSRIPKRIVRSDAQFNFLYSETRERPQNVHEVERVLSILKPEFQKLEGQETRALHERFQLRLFSPAFGALSDSTRTFINQGGDYIVLVPGSVWATKRWDIKGYRDVAKRLLAQGYRVAVTGSHAEQEICSAVAEDLRVSNLSGTGALGDLLYLIEHARGVVCNDSMALHVASAFKIPTAAVFCATSPQFGFGPWNPYGQVIEREGLFCKPCRRHGSNRCPTGSLSCMTEVDPKNVFGALLHLIHEKGMKFGRTTHSN